jgi:hypothetical protein
MRRPLLTLLAGMALCGTAGAQPYPPPAAAPNVAPPVYGDLSDPAYRKFLRSPATFKTFYGGTPGYASRYPTPFGVGGSYVQPGYTRQYITPYDFEAYGYVPGRGEFRATPWSYNRYDAPGYSYGRVYPYGPLR